MTAFPLPIYPPASPSATSSFFPDAVTTKLSPSIEESEILGYATSMTLRS